jgi:hypothetical protein
MPAPATAASATSALNNAFYDLGRLVLHHADVLMVTRNMREAVQRS